MDRKRFKKQVAFILEADKEKNILRQTHLSGHGRRENDAEHAWHMAMMIYLLKEYANAEFDLAKTMMMALIHDIVEIDAGDTYAYDTAGVGNAGGTGGKRRQSGFSAYCQMTREMSCADYLKNFEANETPEARFAHVMDNFQPLLLNNANDGGDWRAHRVSRSQVWGRQAKTELGSAEIWEYTRELIEENIRKKRISKEDK